jgi:hypothetical protein
MPDRALSFSQWATVEPASGWQFGAGYFTDSGKADLVGYHPSKGTLWVGSDTGAGFSFQQWGTVDPKEGWQFVTGDFTGNGRTDVAGYLPSNGTLWVGENTGTQFRFARWGMVAPAAGWQFGAGYFTGGGKADLFGYHPSNGTLWVGLNTGAGFSFQQWGTVDPKEGWQFVTGDFTGNGRTDVAGYHPSNGTLWVGENTGIQFRLGRWAAVSPPGGWQFAAGVFTGGAKADLFGYHPSNGTLWVGSNTGAGFSFQQWATVDPNDGWQFVVGAFGEDLWVDVVGYHPSNGTLWLGKSSTRAVEGYCWPLSGAPGDEIAFMLSGIGGGSATFERHVSHSEIVDSVQVGGANFTLAPRGVPAQVWRSGCGWEATFKVTIPETWQSGIYSARCVDADGTKSDITFIVKPSPARHSRIAVLANVNTWLAYNGWGGQSKYSGAARVSFLRPCPGAAPDGDLHLTRGELWVLGWLEREGYSPDVFTDIDFHEQGSDPSRYRLLVLSTHPEYWTTRMYDNLKAYLNAGGSVAYLGGNGIYENGEYEPDRTGMVFRAGVEGGPRADALFRLLSPARPERSVLGVATERCGAVGSAYEVVAAGHPLFAGTGLSAADPFFGQIGLNTGFGNGKASAWEVDTRDGPGATWIPSDCATEDRPVPLSDLPSGLIVLARGQHDGVGPGAEMVYYDHPGGGFVFSVGSITFGGSLVVDPKIQQLMRNVLAKAGIS